MTQPLIATLIAAAIAGAVAVAVAVSGGTAQLGAHPFWAQTVPLLGLIGALPVFAIALMRWRSGLALALLVTLAGAAGARFGKAAFAASFAENTVAGQAWFFGWIALSAGATALIAMVILQVLRKARPA